MEKDSEVKLRPVQLPISYPIWFKITAKMRFYVTWGFQRTPPLGSQVTSDHTGISCWLNWEGEKGLKRALREIIIPHLCPSSSSYTKENLVTAWLGFISFHTAGSPMAVQWCHQQGLDVKGEPEAEHAEIRSARKPAARWLGHQYPSAVEPANPCKAPCPNIYTNLSEKEDF